MLGHWTLHRVPVVRSSGGGWLHSARGDIRFPTPLVIESFRYIIMKGESFPCTART